MNEQYAELDKLIKASKNILILQADNPDGDSLGSSLALEAILREMNKNVYLICGVDMPTYLHHMEGWSRVTKDVPSAFDMTIIVDTSAESLFDVMNERAEFAWIKSKPVVVIDHHQTDQNISFASTEINEAAVATSEVIHRIAQENNWHIPLDACEYMAMALCRIVLG